MTLFMLAQVSTVAAQVQYSYDPNGRLVRVTMPNGAFATYTYDPDGNILSITNSAATAVSITGMTPQAGPSGTTVTLQGNGFDPVAASNTVQFNGTSAVVSAASATALQVMVPQGATTGTVSVTNSHGSAVAPTPFTVLGAASAPTISQISPAAAGLGAAVTITGTNFNPSAAGDTVSFGSIATSLKSATATSIVANVPTQSSSGKVTVTTANGAATSTVDFYAVPNAFTPANITTKIRLVPSAAAQTITVAAAPKAALMIFDAVAGQKLYFAGSSNTFSGGPTLTVYSPTGSVVPNTLSASTSNFSADSLPVTGTYTASLSNPGAGGHIKYQILPAPADVVASLPLDGSPISFSLATDQSASYTFNGTAGQIFDIETSETTASAAGLPRLYVVDSEGNVITDVQANWTGTTTVHIPPLPSSGTYTVRLSPLDLGTSAGKMRLISVAPPATGTFAIDGPAQTIQLAQYQSAKYTFNGTAGQKLYFAPSNSTFPAYLNLTVIAPDQSEPLSTSLIGTAPEANDLDVLPVTGVYTVLMSTPDDSQGTMTVALATKPADQTTSTTVNGSASQLSLGFDQAGVITFAATKNQSLWIKPTVYSFASCMLAALYDASESFAGVTSFCDSGPSKNDFGTISATGTYHLKVTRDGDPSPGSMTYTIKTVPAEKTGTVAVNGAAVTVTLSEHQNGRYTFSGSANNVVTVATSAQTLDSSTNLMVYAPDGSSLDNWYPNSPSDTHTLPALPASGTYTITIVPSTTTAGKVTIKATK